MPVEGALKLESCKELAAPYFLARRELGAINIGFRVQICTIRTQAPLFLDRENTGG